eukprot:COSAG03_NODE_10019_length_677_cov_3024.081315_1_plen_29_part_10
MVERCVSALSARMGSRLGGRYSGSWEKID